MTVHRIPSRRERKSEFKRRGLPFQPLYGGREMQAPLNIVLGKIEHMNLRDRHPKPVANGDTTSSSPGSQGTEPPDTDNEATT